MCKRRSTARTIHAADFDLAAVTRDVTSIMTSLGHDHEIRAGQSGVLVGLGWAERKTDVRMKGFNYANQMAAVVCQKHANVQSVYCTTFANKEKAAWKHR